MSQRSNGPARLPTGCRTRTARWSSRCTATRSAPGLNTHTHTHTHTHAHTHAQHTHIHTRTHTRTHTSTHLHTHRPEHFLHHLFVAPVHFLSVPAGTLPLVSLPSVALFPRYRLPPFLWREVSGHGHAIFQTFAFLSFLLSIVVAHALPVGAYPGHHSKVTLHPRMVMLRSVACPRCGWRCRCVSKVAATMTLPGSDGQVLPEEALLQGLQGGVLEPGGCTAFRSHSNSNMLTHPARGQVALTFEDCDPRPMPSPTVEQVSHGLQLQSIWRIPTAAAS